MTQTPTRRPARPASDRVARVAAATPASRHRVIDFLRAAAITVVVLGHWTIVAVDPRGVQPHGVLDNAAWSHPLTWLFQVMPVFFLVGGYANGLSWRSARRKGVGYGGWLRARLRRLGLPLIPLLLVWLGVCSVLIMTGVAPEAVRVASQMALIPTWFLAAYLLVIVLAPACLVLWERFGWASIAAGVLLAGLVDVISIGGGSELAGYPNYLIVWASFHQFGYAWLDGRLATVGRKLLLAGVGAVGLAVLVGLGPYPISMITAAGDEISNSSPTRVTMAFLGMLQAGLVLLAEAPLTRWLQRPRVWFVTVVLNSRIMTWFLWHLTAMVGVASLLVALGGIGLGLPPLSPLWWLTRPLWWLVLLAVTYLLVLIFGRFESPGLDERPPPAAWRPVAAAACVCAGLAVMASSGMVGPDGVRPVWPLLPIVGLAVFGVLIPRRRDRRAVRTGEERRKPQRAVTPEG